MSTPISPLRILPADSPVAIASGPEGGFAETLRGVMEDMGQVQSEADGKVSSLLGGSGADVHSALEQRVFRQGNCTYDGEFGCS